MHTVLHRAESSKRRMMVVVVFSCSALAEYHDMCCRHGAAGGMDEHLQHVLLRFKYHDVTFWTNSLGEGQGVVPVMARRPL